MTTSRGKAPLTESTPNGRQQAKPRGKTPAPEATRVPRTAEPGPEQLLQLGGADVDLVPGLAQCSRSTIMAMPWPPPTHIVSRPKVLSSVRRSLSRVQRMRAPVIPNG